MGDWPHKLIPDADRNRHVARDQARRHLFTLMSPVVSMYSKQLSIWLVKQLFSLAEQLSYSFLDIAADLFFPPHTFPLPSPFPVPH